MFEGFLGGYHAGLVLRIALPVHLRQGIHLNLLQFNGFLQVGGRVLFQHGQFVLLGLDSLVHLGLLEVPVHFIKFCIMDFLQEFQLLIQFILVLYLGLRIVHGNLILLRREFLLLIEPFLGAFRQQGEFQGEHLLLCIQPGAGGIRLLLQPFLRFPGGFLPGGGYLAGIPAHGILIVGVRLDHTGVGIGFRFKVFRAGLREGVPAFDKFVFLLCGLLGPGGYLLLLRAGFLQELDAFLCGILVFISGLRTEFRDIPFRFGILHRGIPLLPGYPDFLLRNRLLLPHFIVYQVQLLQEVHELTGQPADTFRHALQNTLYRFANTGEYTKGRSYGFNAFFGGFKGFNHFLQDAGQDSQDGDGGSGGHSLQSHSNTAQALAHIRRKGAQVLHTIPQVVHYVLV